MLLLLPAKGKFALVLSCCLCCHAHISLIRDTFVSMWHFWTSITLTLYYRTVAMFCEEGATVSEGTKLAEVVSATEEA